MIFCTSKGQQDTENALTVFFNYIITGISLRVSCQFLSKMGISKHSSFAILNILVLFS